MNMKYFGKEWYYNNRNKDYVYSEEQVAYLDYENAILPNWYKRISLHDSYIVNVKKRSKELVLELEYDDQIKTKYSIVIYNYQILESCSLINSTIVSNEVYYKNGKVEFHIMVDLYEKGEVKLEYFTLICDSLRIRFKHPILARLRGFPTKNLVLDAK